MSWNKKVTGYTLIELIIVMALSIIIISLIFMALFLIQKQIESNKEEQVYDQTLLMNIIDHHLYECQDIVLKDQSIFFEYPHATQKIKFSGEMIYLNDIDSLRVNGFIDSVSVDNITGLLKYFHLVIRIGKDDIVLHKKTNFSNSNIMNNKFIDFTYSAN